MKYKLIHDRPVCIGCGACESIAPKYWEMADDGKSDIIDAPHKEDSSQEKDLEEDYDLNLEAAQACPVNCIHIKKDGKDVI